MLRKWRLGISLIFTFGLVLAITGGGIVVGSAWSGTQGDEQKVTICHATNSESNPYVVNTPAIDSIVKGEGHDGHNGPIWAAGDKAADITWGDIIPKFDYSGVTGDIYSGHYPGKNWTNEGQDIYSDGCQIVNENVPTVVSTVVFDGATNQAWSGTEQGLAYAYDTARVVGASAVPKPTGTVTYTFYTNGTCTGDGSSAGTVTLSATGVVPNSAKQFDLAAGSYSFKATYSGDGDFAGSTSACEPFSVKAVPPPTKTNVNVSTIVFDAATGKALIDLKLPAAGSVYDTSKVVAPSAIPAPTGTISYTFYKNGTCAQDGTAAGTDLALGANSSTKGPLEQGNYSFTATYSGDSHYNGKTSACEPFSVAPAQVTPTPSPTPTGGVEAATATPTGGVLAATGGSTPDQSFGLFLAALGLLAMIGGAFAWRRREA